MTGLSSKILKLGQLFIPYLLCHFLCERNGSEIDAQSIAWLPIGISQDWIFLGVPPSHIGKIDPYLILISAYIPDIRPGSDFICLFNPYRHACTIDISDLGSQRPPLSIHKNGQKDSEVCTSTHTGNFWIIKICSLALDIDLLVIMSMTNYNDFQRKALLFRTFILIGMKLCKNLIVLTLSYQDYLQFVGFIYIRSESLYHAGQDCIGERLHDKSITFI